ncbi:MAG: hypothetical protein U5K32_02155 [Bacteroidales bacterium]|nr:hypothetical protein [Bacteroidales bacterium]
MGFYQLHKTQKVPATLDEVWDFISSPASLKKITPKYMGFDLISELLPHKMYPGIPPQSSGGQARSKECKISK